MNKFFIYSITSLLALPVSQMTFASETVIVQSIAPGPQTQQIVTQQPIHIITTSDGQTYYQAVAPTNAPNYQTVATTANPVYQVVAQQPQPVQQVVYQQVIPAGTQQIITQQPPAEEPKKKGFLSSLARNVGGSMLQVALPGPIGNIAGGIVKGSD